MNKMLMSIFMFLVSVSVTLLLLAHLSDVKVIYSWYLSKKKLFELEDALVYDVRGQGFFSNYYYITVHEKNDIARSIELGEKTLKELLLQSGVSDHTEHELLIYSKEIHELYKLLGELYYYNKNYTKSSDYFWKALLQEPGNEVLAHNYEYSIYLDTQFKNSKTMYKEETFSQSNDGSVKNVTKSLPITLEKSINKTSSFIFYVKEKNLQNNKQW